MDPLNLSAYLYWAAVTLYAIATAAFMVGLFWRRHDVIVWTTWLVAGALLPHGAAILLRWIIVGHGPYINRYEVLSSDVWVGLAAFLALQLRFPRLRLVGAAIAPIALLLMGISALSTADVEPLPPSLRSYWLVIHVGFAKLAFGNILLAFGLGVLFLLKERSQRTRANHHFYERLPVLARMDELSYRFTGLGFVFLAVMIMSGSIWANDAWGNYWSWDAIETWSLATWLFYGINLHLRATYRWRGPRAAWLTIATFAFMAITLKGVAYITPGAHVEYLAK
ncbi:MAG: c-type cytochrome biogenesis protein CcsB [Chloroflexota bacterium]|nr:MAG: c-type cytochrome biogenesis protein CcsB [Chloroflexota bacterium]